MLYVDTKQIKQLAELIKNMPDAESAFNFYSYPVNAYSSKGPKIVAVDMYPPLHHPHAVDFFFFVMLHNHGFWYNDEKGYSAPIVGTLDGVDYKGSDLLWRMIKRAFDKDPFVVTPLYLANVLFEEMMENFFTDDKSPVPFPDLQERYDMTRAYGQWFVDEGATPEGILNLAHMHESPLAGFLESVGMISGYDADPLEKKNILLAAVLANRPEEFLNVNEDDHWDPIVDYHVMRVALRLGLVRLTTEERCINEKRLFVDAVEESFIRQAVYSAITLLIKKSGRSMSFVDEKMWNARRYCPEMTEPQCGQCVFKDVCKKDTALFQPVFRTTAY